MAIKDKNLKTKTAKAVKGKNARKLTSKAAPKTALSKFIENLWHSRLLSYCLALLLIAVSITLFSNYLPYSSKDSSDSKALKSIPFSNINDSHIGNYLLMEYFEKQNRHEQTRQYYGAVSRWLDDQDFQGQAFLGYLRVGDYDRAAAFLGRIKNPSLSDDALNLSPFGALISEAKPYYGDWEKLYHAVIQLERRDYQNANQTLNQIKNRKITFREAQNFIRYLTADKIKVSPEVPAYQGSLGPNVNASLLLSRLAMRGDWQRIYQISKTSIDKNQQLNIYLEVYYLHALYHLGMSEQALAYIDGAAETYQFRKLFYHNIRDGIENKNLIPLPDRPEYYIADNFLLLAELLSTDPQNRAESLLMARLGLYLVPDHARLYDVVAELSKQEGNIDAAIATRTHIANLDDNDNPYRFYTQISNQIALSQLYAYFDHFDDETQKSEDERLKKSVAIFNNLQKNHPEIYQFYFYEGNLWRINDDYRKALKLYNKAFKVLPIELTDTIQPSFEELEKILNNESIELRNHPDFIAWYPLSDLIYKRAITYERLGKWQKAEKDFLLAASLKPNDTEILNYLGYSWVDEGVNIDDAIILLQRAVLLSNNSPEILDSLGWAYYRQGEHKKAAEIIEFALEVLPNDPVINDHLGDVYWQMGLGRDAHFQWQRSLHFADEQEQIKKLKNKLKTNEGDAGKS